MRLIMIATVLLLVSCSKESKSIAIQPFGDFDNSLIDSVKKSIEQTFFFDVYVLSTRQIPNTAFTNIKSPRYSADSLIRILKRNKPEQYDHVIGLLSKDISTTKKDRSGEVLVPSYKYEDWGVFGLGYRPGASCIVSTFRLKTADKNLFIERLKKVCNHELGHNLGLSHCTSGDKCVMKDAAESIKTVDHVHLTLCSTCRSKVL